MTVAQLLSEHARIMNAHGLDSKEESEFLESNKDNQELMELCQVARQLKKALCVTRNSKFSD